MTDSGDYCQIDDSARLLRVHGNKLPRKYQDRAISRAIDGRTLYIGTEHNGVLRFQRND